MFFPSAPAYPAYVVLPFGSARRRGGIPPSHNPLTHPENAIISHSHDASHDVADIAAHSGLSPAGGTSAQISGISSLTTSTTSRPGTRISDQLLHQFDDAPYVPPRVAQAELHSYPASHPRADNVYDAPNHDMQHQYPYEGGTSPADSHHSTESNWSASSSSSTSSHHLPHDYLVDTSSQYPQNSIPLDQAYPQHYPAYHGQHRHGLEHVRFGEHPSQTGGSYYRTSPQGYPMNAVISHEMFEDARAPLNMPAPSYPSIPSQGSLSSSVVSATNQPLNISTFSVSPTSPVDASRSHFSDAGPYLRQQLGLAVHESISLQSLPDPPPGEKPSTPLPMLIKLAIYGSPNKQLTLQEIYTELEKRFQWFRDHKREKAWKNSIRHNLSLNKVFQHVPRPITEPGKGSYWQLDVSGGEGYKRPRKRRPKNRMVASEEEDEGISDMDEDRPSTSDPTGRSSTTPVDDASIDPGPRGEGHVVGEARTRSATRRAGGSPYPSQSPRYQQGQLPAVAGQDSTAPGQSAVRFGHPSFGQTSFPTFPQAQQIPAVASSASFTALSSATIAMAPTTLAPSRPPPQRVALYDRTAHVPHPVLPPRSGIEYVTEPGGLPAARRIRTSPEIQEPFEEAGPRSSPGSSSGSSRTWNRSRMQGS